MVLLSILDACDIINKALINTMSPIPQLNPRANRSYGELGQNDPNSNFGRGFRFKKPKITKFLIKKALMFGVVAVAFFFIFGTIAFAWISSDLPDPSKLTDRQISQSTKIYDRTGTHILYEIYQDQKRTSVTLDQMNPFLPKAVVAIEDKHFYEHKGVRYISIARAMVSNLLNTNSGSGGASTITQQLIKNAIIGDKKDIFHKVVRKVKELVLAPRLEKKYTKDQILQMYLNEIPFGSTNYGVESAAQSYFQKSAKDLTLAESASLAALIQRPSYYLNHTDVLRERRDYVLKLMVEQGYISEVQKIEAVGQELKITKSAGIKAAPHFVLYVKQLLADQFGEKTVDSGGLKVITTLDFDKQKLAEETVKTLGDKYAKEYNANNAALVSIDPKTAQVLAMVGSRDFFNEEIDGQFNVAVLGKRQPGSSFKPFVYTYAFEKGYTPDTVLYDVLTNFDMRTGEKYTPKNYDNKEHGLVTIRTALQGSLNIPAVKTLYLVGTKETIEFAKRFGYTTFTGDPGLSLVLGGAEVNLLEHTNAYATLADSGLFHSPVSILKVDDTNGNNLYEWKPTDGSEAVKPELAATIANVLSDDTARAYIFGRNSTLTLPGRPVAAKTGTTNNYFDAWTMGFTPSLATGVWVGNTNPSTMKGGGNTLAGQIWNTYMREALKNTPVEQFPAPPTTETTKPVLHGNDGGINIKINKFNNLIATSSTPAGAIIEKTFLPSHDILHYVDRNDPQGPIPTNPSDDPQYFNWENALQDWVKREYEKGNIVSLEDPPTEYDNTITDPTLAPKIEIITPLSGEINTRQFSIQVQASAPRGITKVFYQIDNKDIGASTIFPFGLEYYARTLNPGQHTLSATAQDDQGNSTTKEIVFNLTADFDPPTAVWFGGDTTLNPDDFPRVFTLTPFRWGDTKDIKIILVSGSIEKLIYTFDHNDKLDNNNLTFTWKHSPNTGNYQLKAVCTSKTNQTTESTIAIWIK